MFRRAILWLLPPAFCLAVYWPGLFVWFFQDDFVWLALRLRVHDFASLCHELFVPAAHGTLRVLSERAFFLSLTRLFGVDALPFHMAIFATQFANMALITAIVRALTGSWWAALAAPILWIGNARMAVAMTYSSTFIQVSCGLALLGAFRLLLLYQKTGSPRYWRLQWLVFLLGFGAMETIVVYPAIALAYAWCCARSLWKRTLPLFVPSMLFLLAHGTLIPVQKEGPYAPHLDWGLPLRVFRYWRMALDPTQRSLASPLDWRGLAVSALVTVLLLGFVVWKTRRGDRLPLFFLAWFFITLAPVLPLRDQVMPYYLTLPAIGLGMLGAYALACALRERRAVAVACSVLAVAWVVFSAREVKADVRNTYRGTQRIRAVLEAVSRERAAHPGSVILLDSVDDGLFRGLVQDRGFAAMGIGDVYVTRPGEYSLSPDLVSRYRAEGRLRIYRVKP